MTLIETMMVLVIGVVIVVVVVLIAQSQNEGMRPDRDIQEAIRFTQATIKTFSVTHQGEDLREVTGAGESSDLPIDHAKLTFGATDFKPGPNFGVAHVGPLDSEACIALGSGEPVDVVKYVVVNKEADFTGSSQADLAAPHSVKDPGGHISIADVSAICKSGPDGFYVHYYFMN